MTGEHIVKIPLHGLSVTICAIVKFDIFMQMKDVCFALIDNLPRFCQVRHNLKRRVQRHQGVVRVVRHPKCFIPWRGHAVELEATGMDIRGIRHTQCSPVYWRSRFTLVPSHSPTRGKN